MDQLWHGSWLGIQRPATCFLSQLLSLALRWSVTLANVLIYIYRDIELDISGIYDRSHIIIPTLNPITKAQPLKLSGKPKP